MNPKIVLSNDSQKLTAYQRCPQLYKLSHVDHLQRRQKSQGLSKGSFIHHMFEFVNKRLIAGDNLGTALLALQKEAYNVKDIDVADVTFLYKRFLQYWEYWSSSQERFKLVTVEKGFTKTLYEDDTYLFTYEGKIDALFHDLKDDTYFWRDYKSRKGAYSLYPHNNQFLGYCWSIEGRGEIDYISTAKHTDKTDLSKIFEKTVVKFHQSQIDRWVSDTVQWYFRMLEDSQYTQNRSSCQTMYGVCQFSDLCERNPEIHPQLIKIDYETREPWTAWS